MKTEQVSAVSEDWVPGSRKLFFFFGGIAGSIGMPPFEFYRASGILSESRVFLRDVSQSWYQRGLPGIGEDIFAIGSYLQSKIEQSGAEEIRFVGNSMGGFAALLFCAMLRRGEVIAFAPQSFISAEKRALYKDERWPVQIAEMHQKSPARHVYDLGSYIQEMHPELRAQIHVSTADALDMIHARELQALPQVKLHYYPEAGHALVTWLRDQNALGELLKA